MEKSIDEGRVVKAGVVVTNVRTRVRLSGMTCQRMS
jgi:hypothetical protein